MDVRKGKQLVDDADQNKRTNVTQRRTKVEGNSARNVTKASQKRPIVVDKAVNNQNIDYTHFVSLPLAVHPGLVDKLEHFQNSILGTAKDSKAPASKSKTSSSKSIDSGIEKSIFIKPRTFHLTVLMLKLWNEDRVKLAVQVLQSVSSKVMDALENRPVSIRLKGLDLMIGSLSEARVLYAPVKEIGGEGRLLHACEVITDAFIAAGLVNGKDAQKKLKLHATLMNVRHRIRRNRTRDPDFFDPGGIFDKYGTEEWGEYHIHQVHLSQRFAFDENGYFHCCASMPFPSVSPTRGLKGVFMGCFGYS